MTSNVAPMKRNALTAAQWADRIRDAWRNSVGGIFEIGNLLETARLELGPKGFAAMVRDDLKFPKSMVSMLTTISCDEKLRDVHHGELPSHWRTLYDLTRLTSEQFALGLERGIIHAGMQRKDIKQLRDPKGEKQPRFTRSKVIPLPDSCAMAVRNIIVEAMRLANTSEELTALFVALRDELTDLERDASRITQHGHIT